MPPAIPISRSPSRAHLRRKEHGEGGAPGYYHAKHLHFHCLHLLSSPATVVHPLIQKVNLKGSGQECPLHTPPAHPHPRRDRGKSPP